MLGLAPDTESARLRSAFSEIYENLNEEIPIYKEKIRKFLKKTNDPNIKNQIKFYDKIPTCACFFIDSQLIFCFLLCNKRGRECVHFFISKQASSPDCCNQIFEEFEGHFLELYNDSKSFDSV